MHAGCYITMETEWPVLPPQDLITIELLFTVHTLGRKGCWSCKNKSKVTNIDTQENIWDESQHSMGIFTQGFFDMHMTYCESYHCTYVHTIIISCWPASSLLWPSSNILNLLSSSCVQMPTRIIKNDCSSVYTVGRTSYNCKSAYLTGTVI